MNQIFATVVALSAITGVTIYEGVRFGFWNSADPEELARFSERLKSVPESFGDWYSEPAKVDPAQLAAAEVRAHVSRDYKNRKTGAKVNVSLVCGKTHPMAIHSPDQCYPAVGFAKGDTNRKYVHVNGRAAEFWGAQFTRDDGLRQERLEIVWAWAADEGDWQAPTIPRPHFSDKNALYKLYVITDPGAQSDNKDANQAFLEDFLPILDKLLFKPVESESEAAG